MIVELYENTTPPTLLFKYEVGEHGSLLQLQTVINIKDKFRVIDIEVVFGQNPYSYQEEMEPTIVQYTLERERSET